MSNKQKLKRITDLFTEGETCFLGDDENAKPVCVWVQKNNSIEEEEARLDAQSARTQVLLSMADGTHPEVKNAEVTISEWSDEELFQAVANQKYDECLTLALADVEAEEDWKEKLEYLRRQPQLLDDANVPADDPRRVQWNEYNEEYVALIQKTADERQGKILEETKAKGREEVSKEFIKDYKDRLSIDSYVLEAKITKLFYALRECDAQRKGEGEWDHSECNHRNYLVEHRGEIRELPQHVMSKVLATFEDLQVGARNVANFPEPQSSSDSSVPPSDVGA